MKHAKHKIGIGCLIYFAIALAFTGISYSEAWIGIPLGLVCAYFAYRVYQNLKAKQEEEEEEEEQEATASIAIQPMPYNGNDVDENDEYDEEEDVYVEYSIKGINMVGLDDSYLGDFDGCVIAQTNNHHDPYAIAVYIGKKRVGYLPGGNAHLHGMLMAAGGRADASGYIAKAVDEIDGHPFYYGRVQDIRTNT